MPEQTREWGFANAVSSLRRFTRFGRSSSLIPSPFSMIILTSMSCCLIGCDAGGVPQNASGAENSTGDRPMLSSDGSNNTAQGGNDDNPADPSNNGGSQQDGDEDQRLPDVGGAPLDWPEGGRTPQWPLKTSRVLYTDEQISRARQLCNTDPGAIAVKNNLVQACAYWVAIPDEELYWRLPDWRVARDFDVCTAGCPIHGTEVYQHGTYPWIIDRDHPFTITCPVGGEQYPSNDFAAYYQSGLQDTSLLTGPYADDGRGWLGPDGMKYWFVAYACHWHWRNTWLPAVTNLSRAYAVTGDRVYARKALVMLDRIAQIYPGMDYSQQSRYSELIGGTYYGKILNHLWERWPLMDMATAYDLVFDALVGPDALALPWRTAEEIRANIEANFLEEGIDAVNHGWATGESLATVAVVRQNGPNDLLLGHFFDRSGGDLDSEGLNYSYYNHVFKDGLPYKTSPQYNGFWLDSLVLNGLVLTKAGYGFFQHARMAPMFDGPLSMTCTGLFTPAAGDAGSVTSGYILPATTTYAEGYRQFARPGYAWTLRERGALSGPTYATFEDLLDEPLPDQVYVDADMYQSRLPSRLLDGYGMAVLNNARDSVAVSLFYGPRGVHGHRDRLNVELFGHGRKLSPDLGYPDFMNALVPGIFSWSKNTVSHNTIIMDDSAQLGNVHGKVMRFHRGSVVQGVDVDAAGSYEQATTYRRTLVLVDCGPEDAYVVDVFRVQGGLHHALSIHGQEGAFSLTGAQLGPPVTVGTLAGLDVEYGELYDDPVLGAPGYAGPYQGYIGSGYSHLFNWQSAIPTGVVIGEWELLGDPAARLRVHVAPQAGQELIVADARVSPTLKIPTILKYMLLRRSSDPAGDTFVTVWEPTNGRLIDQVAVNEDPSLGTGKDRTVVLTVQRGGIVDTVLVAPQAGSNQTWATGRSSDAAMAFVTEEGGHEVHSFAAGGSHLTFDGQLLTVPATLIGQVTAADYIARSITVDFGGSATEASELPNLNVRVFNDRHSCIYTIGSAEKVGSQMRLVLTGSDVFTGRIKLTDVDEEQRTVSTDTNIIYPLNMAGMCLLTEDLATAVKIGSMEDDDFLVLGDADLQPFVDDLAAGGDAWIADFGVGDLVEIERFVEQ